MGTQADPEFSEGSGNLGRVPRRRASEEKLHTDRDVWVLQRVPLSTQPGTDEHACVKKLSEAG